MEFLETLKTEHIDGFEVLYQCGYDQNYTIENLADDFDFELTRDRIDGSSYKIGQCRYNGPELWATPKSRVDEYTKSRVEALRDFFNGEIHSYTLHCTIKKNGITLVENYGVCGMLYRICEEYKMLESGYFEHLIEESLAEAKQVIKSLCA